MVTTPGEDGAEIVHFPSGAAFESWLEEHVDHQPGVWLKVAKVGELTAAGRMRPSGLAEVEAARADGRWDAAY